MSVAEGIAWYGHIVREHEGATVRIAWMLVEPVLAESEQQAPSYREMAGALRISSRTVGRVVAKLEAAGLLRVRGIPSPGRRQIYQFKLKPPSASSRSGVHHDA